MAYTRSEVVSRALAARTNVPGTCYMWTRTMAGSPSVGDVDRDGDADAVDGWKAAKHRHPGHRTPPAGVPVFWSGGRNGYGHAAISLGDGKIRSTDAGGSGKIATVDLRWVEREWGLTYLGWSDDLNGVVIPADEPERPAAPAEAKRYGAIRAAIKAMKVARRTAIRQGDTGDRKRIGGRINQMRKDYRELRRR